MNRIKSFIHVFLVLNPPLILTSVASFKIPCKYLPGLFDLIRSTPIIRRPVLRWRLHENKLPTQLLP